jgi:5'-3' exonuclease
MKVALIDADSILWVAAYYGKDSTVDKMINDLDKFLEELLFNVKADYYVGFLQGPEKSFRRQMFADYKSQRPEAPEWITRLRPIVQDYLTNAYGKWRFEYTKDNFEADDAVVSVAHQLDDQLYLRGGEQEEPVWEPIICSVDKDLKQHPGWNYNTKTKELRLVSEEEARETLALQIITGDVTDNIKPLKKGFGPVTAKKALDASDDKDMYAVHKIFMDNLGIIEGSLRFAENVIKVTLRRDPNYKFELREVPQHIKQLYQVNI